MDFININMPSAAVIIGCWSDHTRTIQQELFLNILNFVNTNPNIELVIISDQHCTTHSSWRQLPQLIFFTEQPIDWIRRYYCALPKNQFTTLSNLLDHATWNNKNKIAIQEQWQLAHLLTHTYSHLKNLYYFGVGWNLGVQRDSIGWGQLCNLIQFKHVRPLNILTHEKLSLVNASVNGQHYSECKFDYPDFSNNQWGSLGNNLRYKKDYKWNYNEQEFVPQNA